MVTLEQANLEEVLLHLRHARDAMRRLMAVSEDWAAKAVVEAEFRDLRDVVRGFARCQLGLPVSRGRGGKP